MMYVVNKTKLAETYISIRIVEAKSSIFLVNHFLISKNDRKSKEPSVQSHANKTEKVYTRQGIKMNTSSLISPYRLQINALAYKE